MKISFILSAIYLFFFFFFKEKTRKKFLLLSFYLSSRFKRLFENEKKKKKSQVREKRHFQENRFRIRFFTVIMTSFPIQNNVFGLLQKIQKLFETVLSVLSLNQISSLRFPNRICFFKRKKCFFLAPFLLSFSSPIPSSSLSLSHPPPSLKICLEVRAELESARESVKSQISKFSNDIALHFAVG